MFLRDFTLTVQGRFSKRRIVGHYRNGGRQLELQTANGGIGRKKS